MTKAESLRPETYIAENRPDREKQKTEFTKKIEFTNDNRQVTTNTPAHTKSSESSFQELHVRINSFYRFTYETVV